MSSNDTLVFILIVPAIILVVKFRRPIATVLIISAATAFFYGVYKIPSVLNEILNVTNVR